METRPVDYFSILNPIEHSRTPAAIHRYKVEPYIVAMFMPSPRTSGAVDGLGTPARQEGCIVRVSNGSLDFSCAGRRSSSIHAYRRHGEASRSSSNIILRATILQSRTQAESAEESSARSSTAKHCRETRR